MALQQPTSNQDTTIIERALIAETKKYLTDKLLASVKDDIADIASKAVAQWYEVRTSISPSMEAFSTININVQLVEKVIETRTLHNPISITIQNTREKHNEA